MSSAFIRDKLGEAAAFTAITDPKFKHNRLSVHLTVPLDRTTVTPYAIVPFILRRGFEGCETHTELARRLGMLYGAWVDAGVSKHGCSQVITLSIQALDDRYALGGEKMVAACAELLRDMLLKPNMDASGFDADVTALEKDNLRDNIMAEINDKRSYAITRCHAIMDADSPASVNKLGYAEDVRAITPLSAAEAYRRLINTAHVEVMFIGSGDAAPAKTCFASAFAARDRKPHAYLPPEYRRSAQVVSETTEQMEVAQAKLVMGFRAGVERNGDHAPTRMMTALWGGTPSSLLFTNVREKMSLCYYCAARFDKTTGIVMLESGVASDKAEQAHGAMLDQLTSLAKGDFTDELYDNTLRMMQNSLRTVGDTLGGLESWYLGQILTGKQLAPEEDYENLARVTRQQVIEAAKAVTLDTVYLLKEKEGAHL